MGIVITPDEVADVTAQELDGFDHVEHAENIALALRLCGDLGVDRRTALHGMWKGRPDPGAMTACSLDFFGRQINFVNGFAANDPESTQRIWTMANERFPDVEKRIVIVNCRADRPDRSQQLGRAIADWCPADHYVLIGSGTFVFVRAAIRNSVDPLKLALMEGRRVEDIFETIVDFSDRKSLVMGMANIGGLGLDVARYFSNRSMIGAKV